MEDPNTTTTGLEACAAFNTMERAYIAVSSDFWPTYRKNERRRRSASAFGGLGPPPRPVDAELMKPADKATHRHP